tara:strand:+ start:10474 stop:12633 length:2160 start_codon:yes stop_codon:yes gene_type:complete
MKKYILFLVLVFLLSAGTAHALGTGGVERIALFKKVGTNWNTVDSGNVGIGTTTPSVLFSVAGATLIQGNLTVEGVTTLGSFSFAGKIAGNLDVSGDVNVNGGDLRLGTGTATSTMTSSGGNLGIATTTPWGHLSVTGAGTLPSFVVEDQSDNTDFVVLGTGNVGIGTTAPDKKFHVMDSDASLSPASANTAFILEENDDTNFEIITPSGNSGGIIFSDGANQGGIRYRHGTDDMILRTGGSDVVAIDSSGNVGIGETSPSYKLHVVDDTANEYAAYIINDNADGSGLRIRADDTDGDEYLLYTEYGGTNVHTVFKTDGNVGIGVTPEATHSSYGTVRFFDTGTIYGRKGNAGAGYPLYYGNNFYQHTTGNDRFIVTDEATQYKQQGGEHIFRVVASGSADTDITWIDAMTIDVTGNVGIGTTTPSELLEVDKDQNAATAIKVNNTNAGNAARSTLRLNSDDKELRLNAWGSGASGNYVSIGTVTVTDILFQTQNNDRMIILSTGEVGIGTTNPGEALDVSTATNETGIIVENTNQSPTLTLESTHVNAGARNWDFITNKTSFGDWQLRVGASQGAAPGTLVMGATKDGGILMPEVPTTGEDRAACFITATGEIIEDGAQTCASSARKYKTDIKPLTYGLDEVLQLQPVFYEYKTDLGDERMGLIADDVYEVMPELVFLDEEGEIDTLHFYDMFGVLVKSIQEQQEQIDKLTAQSMCMP